MLRGAAHQRPAPLTVQAKRGKWQEKREQYQAKESEAFMSRYAARQADRVAEVRDKALDAIDQALDKFREDMHATKLVRQPDGSITEVPAWFMKPRDVAILIDRLQVLFDRLSVINQHQGLTVSTELSGDTLREFIEATRGMGGRSRMDLSPLPRTRRLDD